MTSLSPSRTSQTLHRSSPPSPFPFPSMNSSVVVQRRRVEGKTRSGGRREEGGVPISRNVASLDQSLAQVHSRTRLIARRGRKKGVRGGRRRERGKRVLSMRASGRAGDRSCAGRTETGRRGALYCDRGACALVGGGGEETKASRVAPCVRPHLDEDDARRPAFGATAASYHW